MDILIIEDDEKVSSFLKENLGQELYLTSHLSSHFELKQFIEEKNTAPGLIILDRLLGNYDTVNSIKPLKWKFPDTLIMVLSAINSPAEKASLLDLGVDDYMGKPFSLTELQARVRMLLRRKPATTGHLMSCGDLVIDIKTRTVNCGDEKIDFTNKEFLLLLNFIQNQSKVFSKYQLLDFIWEANLDLESNVLEVTIMKLRKKLEKSGSKIKILSKRNIGYWLEV